MPTSDQTDALEKLYKQNLELAVKNKTLSLLRRLYEISILTLEPKELARQLVDSIEEILGFEFVGILGVDKEKDSLEAMAFSASKSLSTAHPGIEASLMGVQIAQASEFPLTKQNKTNEIADVGVLLPELKGAVKSALAYPLIIDAEAVGVLVIGLNRPYENLVEYERESINSFVGVLSVALDKALIYERLKVMNAHLKELDKQKTEFVSFATHQLRSPITSIKGNASILLEGDAGEMNPMVKDIVQTIYTSIKTMANVVEDYLNISRIELGTMKYTLNDMDFKQLAQEVVSEQKPTIDAKGLAWKFAVDESQTFKVKADPDKFKQVLMNTIDNSIKYTPTGSLEFSLTKNAATGMILFAIKDTGVGISPDVMPLLFQKFSRAKNANAANIHGTGLGLFIAKDIMTAHGGRIWAESAGEGKGSQFYIEIPEAK